MRKSVVALLIASLVAQPVRAAADVRPGAFVGVQVKLPFAGKSHPKPTAALAITPTASRISEDGFVRTRIGEGVALNFTASSKPSLTLSGVRADRALGLTRQTQAEPERKLGLSTGAWIGVGVATVVAAVVVGAVLLEDYCDRKISDLCGDSE